MNGSKMTKAALITFAVVSMSMIVTKPSSAGKREKPLCKVVRKDKEAFLPQRNAPMPAGVSVNQPITFAGLSCEGNPNCCFHYNKYGELKCRVPESGI